MAESQRIPAMAAFDESAAVDFLSYISNPTHSNRERLTYERKCALIHYCAHPEDKGVTKTERNTRTRSTEYQLTGGQLFRKPSHQHPEPRLVVLGDDTFATVVREHHCLQHAGRDKTWNAVDKKYYGITKKEVAWILARCKICALNRPAAVRAP